MGAVETLAVDHWEGPFTTGLQQQAAACLEDGHVLFLPRLGFPLSEADLALLRSVSQGAEGAKNVSYDPETGHCRGVRLDPAEERRLAALLSRYGVKAQTLLSGLVRAYAGGLEIARASFRPAEVANRDLPWRKDDRRRHVDAFPSRPMHGRRILRVFSNVDPEGAPRRWRIGEPFAEHARRFLPRVQTPPPGHAALLAVLGLTHGRQSRYDQIMLGLHDAAKRDTRYQTDAEAELVEFPAQSTWIVFTDAVPHAAIAGRWALEQTFHLDPEWLCMPERAPLAVLERLTGQDLA